MTVPEGLAIAPAHFLTAPEEEYREYIEGDQHKHHVVKIDSVDGNLKMKLFGSFTRVEHRFSFSTEELKNETFCYLTTVTHVMKLLFPSSSNTCNHAIRKSFVISRKMKRCPQLDGALVLNFLCQSVANNEEKLKEYLEDAPETEKCIYKYPWDQLTLGLDYIIESKFGDAEMSVPFSFIQLCKANGMLCLGGIPSKLPSVNCKEIRPSFWFNILERKEERTWKPFGRKEENWEIVHRFSMFLDPCKHPEECNMKHFGTKNSRKKVKGRRTQATGDSVEQTTSGSNNKIQGGSVIHSDSVTFNMTVQKD